MNSQFTKTGYQLQSLKTGNIFADAGWTLDAPGRNRSQHWYEPFTKRDNLK